MKTTLAVLLTCHNRKDTTLKCLRAILVQSALYNVEMSIFLVDDGSIDGTSTAIKSQYPQVTVIKGTGQLFWNGGMRLAFSYALQDSFDYYLWLNDDTVLFPNTINSLIECEKSSHKETGSPSIVIGSTCDHTKQRTTYGGLNQASAWQKTKFKIVHSADEVQSCDTMNGNCVLIPAKIANHVGNIESGFSHGMGDIDYGLRAKKLGYQILIAPRFQGICERNSCIGSYNDNSLSFSCRMKGMFSDKC